MRLSHYSGTCDALAADLADELGAALPNFDRAKFLAACRRDPLAAEYADALTAERAKRGIGK